MARLLALFGELLENCLSDLYVARAHVDPAADRYYRPGYNPGCVSDFPGSSSGSISATSSPH